MDAVAGCAAWSASATQRLGMLARFEKRRRKSRRSRFRSRLARVALGAEGGRLAAAEHSVGLDRVVLGVAMSPAFAVAVETGNTELLVPLALEAEKNGQMTERARLAAALRGERRNQTRQRARQCQAGRHHFRVSHS